jgi:hypothetical protein
MTSVVRKVLCHILDREGLNPGGGHIPFFDIYSNGSYSRLFRAKPLNFIQHHGSE